MKYYVIFVYMNNDSKTLNLVFFFSKPKKLVNHKFICYIL